MLARSPGLPPHHLGRSDPQRRGFREPVAPDLVGEPDARQAELPGGLALIPPAALERLVHEVLLEVLHLSLEGPAVTALRKARRRAARRGEQRRGHVLRRDVLAVAGEHDETPDLVLELADVAGPVVRDKLLERTRRDSERSPPDLLAVLRDEELGE